MPTLPQRYDRIAPWYDLLDAGFERKRYAALRPLMFAGLGGQLLDAGVGTGRNCAYYPAGAVVSGIDTSPAMLARAEKRCPTLAEGGRLYRMDVTDLRFDAGAFDAAVSSFLFCVLPDALQAPALRELGRVVKPGGTIRLLEYTMPQGFWRRLSVRLWSPWVQWAYGARFDRQTERHAAEAGLAVVDNRFVYADLIKMLTLRVA